MVRRPLVASLTLALGLLAMPPTGLLAANGDELISGNIVDAAGKPVAGRVLVFYDNLRDENRLDLVATSRTGAAGQFAVSLTSTPAMEAARSANGGAANFAAYAVSHTGISTFRFFSAKPSGNGWSNRRERLDRFDLLATSPLPDPAFDQEIEDSDAVHQLSPESRSMFGPSVAAADITYNSCYYTLVGTYDRQSPVAELHTAYNDLTGRVWYGHTNQADSDISVGIRADDANTLFYASGTIHVGTSYSSTVETYVAKSGSFGWVQQTSFRYGRYQNNWNANWRLQLCWDPNHGGSAPYEIVESLRWNGTALADDWNDGRFDGQCQTTYANKKMALQSGRYWARWTENLTGFGWSMGVGVGLTASVSSWSGASDKVGFEYWGGTQRSTYWLCGNDDFPAYSARIFAGG
jgi:hypothetical protein